VSGTLVQLGDRIRSERKSQGLTQEALADAASLDRSYIGGIERGERNISFLTLCEIARVLGKDVAHFTGGLPQGK